MTVHHYPIFHIVDVAFVTVSELKSLLINFHDPSVAYTHIRIICMCVFNKSYNTTVRQFSLFLISCSHLYPIFLILTYSIQNDWGQIAKSISRNTSIILLFHLTWFSIIPMKKRDLDLAWTILRLGKMYHDSQKRKFCLIYFFPNFTEVLLTSKIIKHLYYTMW